MKELSIEEKAQRYDEAIEIAEEYYKEGKTLGYANDIVSDIFPELKESEDERIRKAIIKGFENFKNFSSIWENDVTVKDCLVWLEKQAEQKPIVIIPKFRVGDKIWHKNYKGECMHHIIRIENNNYIGDDNTSISISTADKEYELVEKQGEQKITDKYNIRGIKSKHAEGKLGEMIKNLKSADKIEPKFKVGDWIIGDKDNSIHQVKTAIENVSNGKYAYDLIDGGYISTLHESDYHLWTIQDAKDGDVLTASDGSIFLFAGVVYYACKHYVALTTDGVINFNEGLEHFWETSTAVHPATKEQRNTLMKAMADTGYTFDFEKKELKKIEQKPDDKSKIKPKFKTGDRVIGIVSGIPYFITEVCDDHYNTESGCIIMFCSQDNFELYEQNPAWSEEDERMKNQLVDFMLSGIDISKAPYGCVAWLKSLRHHNTWKPSDEQMKILNEVLNFAANHKSPHWNDYIFGTLHNLIIQLKKLRKE